MYRFTLNLLSQLYYNIPFQVLFITIIGFTFIDLLSIFYQNYIYNTTFQVNHNRHWFRVYRIDLIAIFYQNAFIIYCFDAEHRRGDMIQTYKIINGLVRMDVGNFLLQKDHRLLGTFTKSIYTCNKINEKIFFFTKGN